MTSDGSKTPSGLAGGTSTSLKSGYVRLPREEAKTFLLDPIVTERGQVYWYLPKQVMMGLGGKEFVMFEKIAAEDLRGPGIFKKWWVALRALSLSVTATPCFAILLLGVLKDWTLDAWVAALALLGVVLLQVAINLMNDVEDHMRLIDLPGSTGGSGVIQKGWLTARALRKVALVCLVVGILCGLPSFFKSAEIMWAVGLLAVLGTLAYSGWPFSFKYKALGDLQIFFMCGPLLAVGFSVAAFGQWDRSTVLAGVFFGMLACGISHANNLTNIKNDTARGGQTLASLLGFRRARWLNALVACAAGFALIALARTATLYCLLPWLCAPLAIRLARQAVLASGPSSPGLADVRVRAAKLHLISGFLLIAGLGLAVYLRD